jgi:predicted nucleotide-binding protein
MATRRPTQPEDRVLSAADMHSGIERITRRLDELKQLDPRSITSYRDPKIVSLETAIEQTLTAVFGPGTPRFNLYRPAFDLDPAPNLNIVPDWIGVRGGGGYNNVDIHELQHGIAERQQRAVAFLEQAISGLQEDIADKEGRTRTEADTPPTTAPDAASRKVFLVHGHDDAAKNEVALFLRAIELDPIILHLRPNGGRHLLTKFTEESEGAGFAVVLMTPDDQGGPTDAIAQRPRSRQNVVFELGFFIGKLGPAKVAALLKGDVEKPSDFDGIAYIPFDSGGGWKQALARELHHAKVPLDPAKSFSA